MDGRLPAPLPLADLDILEVLQKLNRINLWTDD
jgi:hypothetical protein